MRIKSLSMLITVLCLTGTASHAACKVPDEAKSMQAELLANLNAERASRNLPPLSLDPALDTAAQKHACDNAKRMSISHTSADGSQLQHRLRRAGYDYATAAENTGRGFVSGKRAVEWWMNSPGHKKNILMPSVRDVGVGIALSGDPDNRLHWILVVGATH